MILMATAVIVLTIDDLVAHLAVVTVGSTLAWFAMAVLVFFVVMGLVAGEPFTEVVVPSGLSLDPTTSATLKPGPQVLRVIISSGYAFRAVFDDPHPLLGVQFDQLIPRDVVVPALVSLAGLTKVLQAIVDAPNFGRNVVGLEAAATVPAVLRDEEVHAQKLLDVSHVNAALGGRIPGF